MGFLRLGSGGGLAIALILDIVALATPGWIYVNQEDGDYAQGLWQNATGNETVSVTQGDAEKVAIAFNLMGGVILICAMVALCVGGGKGGKEVIAKVGGVLSFIAGLFIMIGVATYTGLYMEFVEQSGVYWGYSFALAWTACCIAILATPIAFIDK